MAPASDATDAPIVTGDPPTARVPIIVDTDVDVSDLAALAVLLRDPKVDVRAVTIAPTGTGVTNCASGRLIIQYVLEEFGAGAIPFACGRADPGPDGRRFPDEWRLNADEGWGMVMPPQPTTGVPEDAATLLNRAVNESPSSPTVVALGPWTNLEDAVVADPTVADRIAAIHAMGGAIDVPGNVIVDDVTADDGLEWNLAADPSAVNAIFETATPISLVPLDATDDVPIPAGPRRAPGRRASGRRCGPRLRAAGARPDAPDRRGPAALGRVGGPRGEQAGPGDLGGRTPAGGRGGAGHPAKMPAGPSASRRRPTPRRSKPPWSRRWGSGPSGEPHSSSPGELAVRWDGASCAFEMPGGLRPGVAALTFDNGTGDPAAVQIVGVREPHTWQELEALLPTVDPATDPAALPDWVIDAGGLADESGAGGSMKGTVALEASTYGPVCITGTWPDLDFHPGQPFVVAAP